MLHVSLVFWYLIFCIRHRAIPWNYFQLNGNYFNKRKGIFSKIEMDRHIPRKWRLNQYYYDEQKIPLQYPVFIKPEWGQNSNGIECVVDEQQYKKFVEVAKKTDMPFIVQEAASANKEFEVYYLRSPESFDKYALLSITQVVNDSDGEYPVNSVHNTSTEYVDTTVSYSEDELNRIWQMLKNMGKFRMARVGIKAESKEKLLNGEFQVVEINLFLPMPLVLLCENVDLSDKEILIKETMSCAARLVKQIPKSETSSPIFFRKMRAHYKTAQ